MVVVVLVVLVVVVVVVVAGVVVVVVTFILVRPPPHSSTIPRHHSEKLTNTRFPMPGSRLEGHVDSHIQAAHFAHSPFTQGLGWGAIDFDEISVDLIF